MKISMVLVVAMAGGLAFTMPTQKELENAAPVVQERLAKERQSVADGRKTRTEVADAAVIMAASADSEAEKVLLLKGAFTFYVRDGQYGKASETLGALRIAIDRVSDETINSLVKSVEGAVEPEDRPRFHRMMVAGLKSAKVDGVTWYYREVEKGVEIGTGLANLAAVDERTSGRLVIPNEIRGKPVVSVGDGTLYGCTRVESVFIPKSAKLVMVAAFTGCSNLKTIEIDPDNPEYRSVEGLLADKAGTGIGRCPEGRRSVRVPKGTKLIYKGAFRDCSKLESVVIPDGLKRIDNGAFSRCTSLTTVKMPSSVTSIGKTAFEGCDRLSPKPSVSSDANERLVLPDIPVADDNGWRKGPTDAWFVNWDKALAESKKTNKPIFALSTGSDWCGWCKKLKKDVLTTQAFEDFAKKNLVLLYLDSPRKPLPEAQTVHNRTICRELRLNGGVPCAAVFAADARRLGVLSGGGYTASNYVERLEKMLSEKGELPKGGQPSKIFTEGYVEPPKKAITWKYEVVGDGVVLGRGGRGFGPAIDGDAFGALVIPDKIDGKPVRGIGNSAFYGRSGLTSVTIPESVTNIGRSAFYNCSGLKALTIPSGVTSIGGFAFFGCDGLTSITLPKRMTSIGEFAFRSCCGLTSMTIPEGVTRIESATFLFCTGLKSVTIPASVEGISYGAFSHCDALLSFAVDESNPAFCSKNGLICSKDGSKLVVGVNGNVTIPDGVEVVKSCAFDDLAGLLTVKMPASVTTVDEEAFQGCNGLMSFSVDASNPAFCSRSGLLCSKDGKNLVVGVNGDVAVPYGVERIGNRAFCDFSGLKSIVLPESVTSVGHRAFDGCSGLADQEGFVVVRGVLHDYVGRASSVNIPEGVTSVGGCAFYWSGLKSVTFPSSVTNIGGSAFYCCKGLETLSIPPSVAHIGNGAFEHCTGLKSVTMLSDRLSIEGGAFGGCKSLVDVDIRGTDVKIAKSAFRGDTPVGAKMPDLSRPVGPLHVVAGKDAR